MSSKSLNKVMLIGNLTRDPELKVTPSGAAVCTFGVATNSRYKKPDGNYEEITNFHNIVAWSKLAEICAQKLKKGMKVYVEGTPEVRTFQKQDGSTGASLSLRVREVQLLGGKADGPSSGGYNQQGTSQVSASNEVTESVDDLPF